MIKEGKPFEEGPHLYTCGDGQLYQGTPAEIEKMLTDFSKDPANTHQTRTQAGLQEFKLACQRERQQEFRQVISSFTPTPTSTPTAPEPTVSRTPNSRP